MSPSLEASKERTWRSGLGDKVRIGHRLDLVISLW